MRRRGAKPTPSPRALMNASLHDQMIWKAVSRSSSLAWPTMRSHCRQGRRRAGGGARGWRGVSHCQHAPPAAGSCPGPLSPPPGQEAAHLAACELGAQVLQALQCWSAVGVPGLGGRGHVDAHDGARLAGQHHPVALCVCVGGGGAGQGQGGRQACCAARQAGGQACRPAALPGRQARRRPTHHPPASTGPLPPPCRPEQPQPTSCDTL